ncbi:cobalamin biosynthesis protein, partial [Enterobacter cloacae]|uniref:cobalamin biosynthesis protein n=2 Tax=Pseudomonadota TaxID=1224 RepID=UPI0013D32017
MVEEPKSAARYTLGLGCERGCDPAELRSLAESVLHAGGVKPGDLTGIHSLDARAAEPAMVALA